MTAGDLASLIARRTAWLSVLSGPVAGAYLLDPVWFGIAVGWIAGVVAWAPLYLIADLRDTIDRAMR